MALKLQTYKGNRKLSLEEVLAGLVNSGLIAPAEAELIQKKRGKSSKHPLVSIFESQVKDRRDSRRKLSMADLTKWLSEYCSVEYFHIDPLKIDISSVTQILPKAFVKRIGILPVLVSEEEVIYATSEPFLIDWTMDVERTTKKRIKIVLSNPVTITNCIEDFYTVHNAVQHLNRSNSVDLDSGRSKDLNKIMGIGDALTNISDESGISGIVDWLFQYAYDERATDIHLEPKQGEGIVRFRVDGMLREVYKFDPGIMLSVLSRIKILSEMKVDEKRRPQDGRIKRSLTGEKIIEIRASSIPTHYGEKIVLRIFDPEMADVSLEGIGFEGRDLELWKELAECSFGMMLVTGPTGSGKSTTLHATLRHLVSPEVNICTAEDPVEIIEERFNQMQVNKSIDLTFANAIKYFMRQDPDIIMVGEIRDGETSDMAVQASLTGHMVFSTLHTNDALSAFTRLLDLGVPPHLLNATLKGVLAQRLIRVLCSSCKKKVELDSHLWQSLCSPHNVKRPDFVFEPVGCNECQNTGYIGRACIYEIIPLDDELKSVITKDVELRDLKKKAEGKYLPMRLFGAKKVIEGLTSIEEVLRVVV